jgi:translation initiation factor 2-alpha kinase 1
VFVSFDESDKMILFQLGDFGLACPLDNNEMICHNGIGTRLYAAGEQLEGKICSKKSDIYSMGIILIELLLKIKTIMECFKKVEKIKKGEPLQEIDGSLSKLISRLLSSKTDTRPDVSELKSIVHHLMDSSSDEVARLKNIIEDKDKKIDELMREIKALRQLSQD